MSRAESLNALYDRIRRIEAPAKHGVLPFGVAEIDRALPGGGLALGAVHEILSAGGDEEDGAAAAGFIAGILARLGPHPHPPAAGNAGILRNQKSGWIDAVRPSTARCARAQDEALSLMPSKASLMLRSARRARLEARTALMQNSLPALQSSRTEGEGKGVGPVLWCLRRPDLYGPGLAEHGLHPARLVLVVAKRDDELLWATEEGLRVPGLAAVVGEVGRLPMVAGRRLQLAAERSGVTAFLLRRWRNAEEAARERERPSAALTRWRVTALPSYPHPAPFARRVPSPASGGGLGWGHWIECPRWRIELLRCRGGTPAAWEVEVADATGHVSLSAALADRPAAPRRRATGQVETEPLRRTG